MSSTPATLSPVGDQHRELSSFDIGIIVLCVVCGLGLAALGIFLVVNRRRLFSDSAASMDDKEELDEIPAWPPLSAKPAVLNESTDHNLLATKKKNKKRTTTTMLDDIPLPPTHLLTPPPSLSKHQVFEEGYDSYALRSPYRQTRLTASVSTGSGESVSSLDPSLLDSLERQKHINGMYTRHHHRHSPSWGSSTIIQQPCLGKSMANSSLSLIEKQEQEAELQRLSISSYHVW